MTSRSRIEYAFCDDDYVMEWCAKNGIRYETDDGVVVPLTPGFPSYEGGRTDAGIDLYSPYTEIVPRHGSRLINTFVRFGLPPGVVGLLRPRGRDDFLIGSGVVDPGYDGPVIVRIVNYTAMDMVIWRGSSVGQMVLVDSILHNLYPPVRVDAIRGGSRGDRGGIIGRGKND